VSEVDLGDPALALTLATGLVSGVVSVWFVKRTTDASKLRTAANRIIAHLLEFRLFADEPSLIFKAQRDLLAANGRLLKCVALPLLLMLAPLAGLIAVLEGLTARAPLPVGEATVVTVQLRQTLDVMATQIRLEAPAAFRVETPPVRSSADAQVSWRVRALAAAAGRLQVHYNGHILTKAISAAPGWRPLSEIRAGTLSSFLLHPLEFPFKVPAVESIRLKYPPATIFHLHWLVWFSLASLVGGSLGLVQKRG
jgi:hypothetical protein